MMASTNNIERLRTSRGWSRPKLGKLMGTSGQQVERLEKGQRKLTQAWIEKAARALGCTPAEIITPLEGELELTPSPPSGSPSSEFAVELQKLDISASMGPGALIDDYVEAEPVTFDLRFIQAITRAPVHRLKLITGVGDSMYPTLNWGDTIMIDTTDQHLSKQDGIYWINLYGAAALKRLRAVGEGRIEVVSDNRDVENQVVEADDLRIEGRAIWFARGL